MSKWASEAEYRLALERYVIEVWWPAVQRDPTQYNYWRDPPEKRMGKFRVVASRDQGVLRE